MQPVAPGWTVAVVLAAIAVFCCCIPGFVRSIRRVSATATITGFLRDYLDPRKQSSKLSFLASILLSVPLYLYVHFEGGQLPWEKIVTTPYFLGTVCAIPISVVVHFHYLRSLSGDSLDAVSTSVAWPFIVFALVLTARFQVLHPSFSIVSGPFLGISISFLSVFSGAFLVDIFMGGRLDRLYEELHEEIEAEAARRQEEDLLRKRELHKRNIVVLTETVQSIEREPSQFDSPTIKNALAESVLSIINREGVYVRRESDAYEAVMFLSLPEDYLLFSITCLVWRGRNLEYGTSEYNDYLKRLQEEVRLFCEETSIDESTLERIVEAAGTSLGELLRTAFGLLSRKDIYRDCFQEMQDD